jgi:hypothetical protein
MVFINNQSLFMKTSHFAIFLFLSFFILSCASTGMAKGQGENSDDNKSTADSLGITARGSVGEKVVVPSSLMYIGNGGSNISLAVLAPEVQGDVPVYLPLYIQGLLNNNINKFSAINLIDRQNLNSIIIEQNLAANGRFSDKDFVSIGKLTNAQYFLFGIIQRLYGNRYSLQLSLTEASTGIRKVSFMKDGTSIQFEGNGAIINEATLELLEQLGIQLTAAGKQALLAGNMSAVQAETGLARGITAQAGGSEVQALFNFTQAITFDPSQLEALSRLNTLSTSISGGTISQRIVNDIQARDKWIEVFKETVKFFNDHPPFEIIFDPSLIQIGEIDYIKRTANLGMNIALNPSEAGFNTLNTLLEGLEKTGRRNQWGFADWPLTDITPKTVGTVLFDGKQTFNCKVDISLLNENKKTLSKNSITLNSGKIEKRLWTIRFPDSVVRTVNFPNVKAEDLTPLLTIVITAVNDIPSARLNTSGYMKIDTGDLVMPVAEPIPTDQPKPKKSASVSPLSFDNSNNKRNGFEVFNIFFQWDNEGNSLLGSGAVFGGIYWSFLQFTSIGLEIRGGDLRFWDDVDILHFSVSPVLGLVFALNDYGTIIYANGILDFGIFDPWQGLITDWLTPGFDIGLTYLTFNLKYRGVWYRDRYTHSIGFGLHISLVK